MHSFAFALLIASCLAESVVFLCNSESGSSNVFTATAYAVLTRNPDIDLHVVSFPPLGRAIESIAQHADSSRLTFHALKGPSFFQTLIQQGYTIERDILRAGWPGNSKFLANLEMTSMPWTGPQIVDLWADLERALSPINASLVVLDPLFYPAHDIVRRMGLKYLMLSQNALKDYLWAYQPRLGGLWRIPATSSGHPYPVPWHLIPSNALMIVRMIYRVFTTSRITNAYFKSQGLPRPDGILKTFQKDIPWLTPSLAELEYPLHIPANVVPVGPIFLDRTQRDEDLHDWLSRAPTVLINLGSKFSYTDRDAAAMAEALAAMLDKTHVQVLWKFCHRRDMDHTYAAQPKGTSPYSEYFSPIKAHLKSNRVRMDRWIRADPASLFDSGQIVLFVHHGGGNSFNEALTKGVPSVILPQWSLTYDNAVRAEWLGVGLWANRQSAPAFTAAELGDALQAALAGTPAERMQERARQLSRVISSQPRGRDVAAKSIVGYMREEEHGEAKDEL